METNYRGTTYRKFGNQPTQTILSSLGTIESSAKTGKVSGTVIKVNGQVFRKATNYARRHFKLELGAAQSSKATWKQNGSPDTVVTHVSTPGGPAPGFVEAAVMYPGIQNVNTGMNTLQDYPTIPGSMMNEAVTKALLDLVGETAGVGENLATAGQTLRMIANPSIYLANGLREVWENKQFRPFLRRTVQDIKDHRPSDIAQRYLEYVYGWKPLMQDIYTLYRMAKDDTAKPLLIRGRGESSRYGIGKDHVYDQGFSGVRTQIQFNTKSVVRCNVWAQVDPNHPGIRSLNQLGLANPGALAWELMSWSFVVDWLLPIGAVLNAMKSSSGLLWVDGSVAVRLKGRGSYAQRRNFDQAEQTNVAHLDGTGTIRYDGYNRAKLNTWPQPGLWIEQDPFKGDREFKAAALAIAALSTLR